MKILFLVLFTCCLLSCQFITVKERPALNELAILQGATDTTSTQIHVLAPAHQKISFALKMDKSVLEAPQPEVIHLTGTSWQLLQLNIQGLTADLLYTLQVFDDAKVLIDERFFKVLSTSAKKSRIAIVSCTHDGYLELQKKQWQQIEQQKPDFLFLIGDNVYADSRPLDFITKGMTPEILQKRYTETWSALNLYKMRYLIPSYAIWDDHDFGVNDGDLRFPFKEESLKIFRSFFPMKENSHLQQGPGASARVLIGNQQFLFLDNRSFRTPKKVNPQSHFGKEQFAWAIDKVKSHKGLTWLISGDQFFGGHHPFESFEGNHPQDFKNFTKTLKHVRKPVLFVSGDRHVAEIMEIPEKELGFKTYELTSSGLHSKMYPGALSKHPNPRSVFGKDGESNYMTIEIDESSSKPQIGVIVWGENMKVYHQTFLEVLK